MYLQFFDDGESPERELPPLGPFELLIIRHNRIIGDREQVEHDMLGLGSVERWLEAELELRRALGDEPGGMRRGSMRIRAPRGDIIVRFYDYAGDEPPKIPELGPFYAITVGKREVRADDKVLAVRSTDISPWTLTDAIQPGIAGSTKADFSVFSLSARDPVANTGPAAAPESRQPTATIAELPAAASEPTPVSPPRDFVERRKVQREVYVARPDASDFASLTPDDVVQVDRLKQQELGEQLMLERLRKERQLRPLSTLDADAPAATPMRFQPPVKERPVAADVAPAAFDDYEPESFGGRVLASLWRFRIALVALLVVMAAFSAYGYLQPRAAGSGPQRAAVGEKVQTAEWTFSVSSVDRMVKLGSAPATNGGYLVVHLLVTKKSADPISLDPSDFQLIDATNVRTAPFSAASAIYPSTGLVWITTYATNVFVQEHLIFDVSPNAKDLRLLIRPANTEVRLPDP